MSKRTRRLPPAEDVLAGRVPASIEELFALIHEANPTDRALPAAEEARRYARKARLQSLLIARFSHALAVEADPRDAAVVSLRHRYADRDACHARVAALDDAARSWVQEELAPTSALPPVTAPGSTAPGSTAPGPTGAGPTAADRSAPSAPERTARHAPDSPDALLAAGRDALDAYDYDAARAAFAAAVRGGGGLPAARALLDLLVQHLADDEAALALTPSDDADPLVAELLATAAARTGDRARALRHLRAVPPPAGADALAALAEQALRAGALNDARMLLLSLRDRDPAHPAVPRLADTVAQARADERRPHEERLEAALAARDWAVVADLVADLGARWPDSAAVRAASRRLDEHRREEEAGALVRRAWTAWESGDAASLLAFLGRARALAPPDPDLAAWMDEAEAAAREQLELSALAEARAALAAGDLPRALSAALRLPAPARAALARERPVPALTWLVRLPDDEQGVPAALALAEAEAALAEAPDTVAGLLKPHARLLRAVPESRALLAAAEAALHARAASAADAALASFEAAMGSSDLDAAAHLVPALPPASRRAAEERLAAAQRAATLAAEEAAALDRGDLLRARAHARARGADTVADLDARVRAAWHVAVHDGLDLPTATVTLPGDGPHPRALLDPTGAEVVFVEACAELLVARIVDLSALRVRRVLSWRLPAQFVLGHVQRAGDLLSVLSIHGALFEAHLADGDVVRWLPPPPELLGDVDIGGVVLAPGGQHVWVTLATVALGYQTRIYDTHRWPAYTVLDKRGFCVPLLGADEPSLLRLDSDRGSSLYGPYGRAIGRRTNGAEFRHTRAAIHPRGRGVCTLVDTAPRRSEGLGNVPPELLDRVADEPLGFMWPYPRSDDGSVNIFPLFSIRSDHELATDRARGRIHVKGSASGFCSLSTYVLDEDGMLDILPGNVHAPIHTRFFVDIESRVVRALAPSPDGLVEIDLGADDRDDTGRAIAETNAVVFPGGGFGADLGNDAGLEKLTDAAELLARALRAVPERDRRAWVDEQLRLHAEDPTTLLDLASAVLAVDFRLDPEGVFNEVLRRFPDHPRRRYFTAQLEARRGRWPEVLALLDGLAPEDLDVRYQSHLLHLRGVARLRLGDRPGAERDLRAAAEAPEPCDVDMPFALLDVLDGCEVVAEPEETPEWRRARLADIVRAILAADEDLAEGRPADAIARLTTALVWRWAERQSRARLAEAWLRLSPADPDARAARHLALAGFLAVHATRARGDGNDLPLLAHAWDAARLDDLAARVRADLGLPAPPDDPLVFREEGKRP